MDSNKKLQFGSQLGSWPTRLLADRMGFGKTSVAIGLSSLSVAPPKIPSRKDTLCQTNLKPDRGSFIHYHPLQRGKDRDCKCPQVGDFAE